MIWVRGEIVPDDALKISVLDRTFAHGLGLFETLRTWNGHATLLPRHTERMRRSAAELGIPIDPAALPDAPAVAKLLAAEGRDGDAALRITASGGTFEPGSAIVWMRASPIPADWAIPGSAPDQPGLALAAPALDLDWRSPLGRHKTLNYWRRQLEFERNGMRESLVLGEDGGIVEGTRTNVFHVVGNTLRTASFDYPILPGVMRSVVLARAKRLGMAIEEFRPPQGLAVDDKPGLAEWARADEVFLTNSLRGIVPVAGVLDFDFPAPGPWTRRLWTDVREWLNRGGIDP